MGSQVEKTDLQVLVRGRMVVLKERTELVSRNNMVPCEALCLYLVMALSAEGMMREPELEVLLPQQQKTRVWSSWLQQYYENQM